MEPRAPPMRSRPRRDPDEEILTHPPGDSSGDEPDGDGEEHVDDEGVEADEHFGRGVGRPPGPAEFYRFRPPTAPCALCGKASEGRDLMVVCPMHSKDPHEPTADACRLPQHPPLPGRPDLGVLACVVLAGYPSRCEVEWCHKRLWCFRDYYFVHPACMGPTAKMPGCIEGCGRPHDRGSTRCTPCRRAHLRDEARLRQSRHRARKSGIAMRRPRKRRDKVSRI